MKKQTVYNIFIFGWLLALTLWLAFISIILMSKGYDDTMKKLGISSKSSDINKLVSDVVKNGELPPEFQTLVSGLLGSGETTSPKTNASDQAILDLLNVESEKK